MVTFCTQSIYSCSSKFILVQDELGNSGRRPTWPIHFFRRSRKAIGNCIGNHHVAARGHGMQMDDQKVCRDRNVTDDDRLPSLVAKAAWLAWYSRFTLIVLFISRDWQHGGSVPSLRPCRLCKHYIEILKNCICFWNIFCVVCIAFFSHFLYNPQNKFFLV